MKRPEKKDSKYFLSTITHADEELAEVQAISMELGHNRAIADYEAFLPTVDELEKMIRKIVLSKDPNKNILPLMRDRFVLDRAKVICKSLAAAIHKRLTEGK